MSFQNTFIRLSAVTLLATVLNSLVFGQAASTTYLQQASDRYQHTIDVYTEADAAGNHFAARGEFHGGGSMQVPAMDEISLGAPCLGINCITATFTPPPASPSYFGGWYFLNGILGATDAKPTANWGDTPNAGYDLTGAASIRFSARGLRGGEKIQFFAFGVGNTEYPYQSYPDSSERVPSKDTPAITLSTTWTQYEIPITGHDLHYVLGGFGWTALAGDQTNPTQSLTFYLDNIQYVKERPTDPRFLVSYETIKSTNSFDSVQRNAAYVYDNAVALIAFIAAGDLERARAIADAMVYAQSNDRFFTDGRLRNAYQGGDLALPPGWLPNNKKNTVRMSGWYDAGRGTWFEDETQVSTTTGNIAWTMLALLDFYETTHESKYLAAVQKLGEWVRTNTWDDRGKGGFTGGYDGWENGAASGSSTTCASGSFVNGQCHRLYKATEHNIDLYSAFSRLYLSDHADKWAQAAQHAKTFFLAMWDSTEGKFWTGTGEDGITIDKQIIPVDIQAWAIQALGSEAGPFLRALDYVEQHHKTSLGYGFKQNGGNQCGDNTWFEGSSQVALSYLLSGQLGKWQSIINSIHSAQMSSGAVPATNGACLNTGFTLNDNSPWLYYPRAHVGATAWLSLAEGRVNPFRSSLYAPALQQVPGSLQQLSVGSDGSVCGVSNVGIYCYDSQTHVWQTLPGWLSQIAVGGNGQVWGLTPAGGVYRFDPTIQNWITIPGSLARIVVGADGDVWGLSSTNQIYHFNSSAENWITIPGTLKSIVAGFNGAVWGLDSGGNIFRFNIGSQRFEQVPGNLSQIAVGGDGDVWGINAANRIWHFNSLLQGWELIAGSLSQISVGSAKNVWGLNAAGNIFTFNLQNQNWTTIPGTLTQISAGQNGAVWGLNASNEIYNLDVLAQTTQAFQSVPGLLNQISVGPDGNVWGISSNQSIFHFNPRIQNWDTVTGSLTQIAVGFGGNVWGINSGGYTFRFDPTAQNWLRIPGFLKQISVGANGSIWGINSSGQIYRYNASINNWDTIPGILNQLSIGIDGSVWGVNVTDQIWRYNPQVHNWDSVPGSLTQIAVGSGQDIWGLNSAGQIWKFNAQIQNWEFIPGSLAHIEIGFDGAVWGINSSNLVYRFNNQTRTWQQIPGSLSQIVASATTVAWGLDGSGSVYTFH